MDRERDDVRLQPFSTLVEREYDYSRPRRGEVRKAVVLSVSENEVIVDLGAKRDGFVPPRDLDLLDEMYRDGLQIGDQVPVYVLDASGPRGEVVVSLNKGLAQEDWLRAKECLASGDPCTAEVTAVNRGGVIVPFGRLRGFVPNSQLTSVPRGMRRDRLEQAKSKLIGRVLSLVVIEVDRRRRRLVLSERAARSCVRQQFLSELTEGEVRTGVVCHLVDFGAFVDLGGVDGLIHVSELDWQHVAHPSEVLSVGDEVEVYVLSVDRERGRVGLSRKRLLPDPWPIVTQRLRAGQTAEGTVTHIAPFGVFVDLGRGVEGLIHTSEMPNGQASAADLRPGSPITVRVLKINRWRRRIALSLRHLPQVGSASRFEHQVSGDHPPVWRV
jgi:small subunit ribosomal protein S1